MSTVDYPPGPKGRRFVGNRYDYERDRIGFLRRCQDEYGDVFSFSPRASVVLDPVLAHEVLVRTNVDFGIEADIFDDTAPEVTARQTPPAMAGRRKSRPGVNRTAADAHSERFVDLLHAHLRAAGEGELDVSAAMKAFVINATTDYCLGAGNGDVADAVATAAARSVALMTSSLSLPPWLPVPRVRAVRAANRHLDELLRARIAHRRAEPHDKVDDLLDTLLSDEREEVSGEAVHRTVSVMLRASHGVPGTALAWAVLLLARRPEMAERVRRDAERLTPVAGRPVTVEDLPYTEAFVKELLRAYIPTWLMGREVRTHTVVGRWAFAPGQQIMIPVYLVHRDPRWWEEPETFSPERWLTGRQPHARFAYLPFGAGPRVCLGNSLGMLQLVLGIAALVRDYDIAVTAPDAVVARAEALLTPAGLRARFTRR